MEVIALLGSQLARTKFGVFLSELGSLVPKSH
jgi:hypothetical protein